jgi:hypothetical protein
MTDHIEVLRRLKMRCYNLTDVSQHDAGRYHAALDFAIAALSAREGGEAVAWQRRSSADGYVSRWGDWNPDEWPTDPFPASSGRWVHEYRQLFLHPAQPASQQTHPTGHRVRSIETNVFTDDFGSLVVMLPSNDWVAGSMVRVTLVSLPTRAAALDQEKGR